MRRLNRSDVARVESALDLAERKFETVTGAAMAGARAAERLGLTFIGAETGVSIEHPATMAPGEGAKVLRVSVVPAGRFIRRPEEVAAGAPRYHGEPEAPSLPEIETTAPAEVQHVEMLDADEEARAIREAWGETAELGALLAAARAEKRIPSREPKDGVLSVEEIRPPPAPPVRLAAPAPGAPSADGPGALTPSASGLRIVPAGGVRVVSP